MTRLNHLPTRALATTGPKGEKGCVPEPATTSGDVAGKLPVASHNGEAKSSAKCWERHPAARNRGYPQDQGELHQQQRVGPK